MKRIAVYKSLEYGWDSVFIIPDNHDDQDGPYELPNYVQVSAIIEVEFPPLEDETVRAAAVACIDRQKDKIRAEYTEKMEALDRRKSELLALPSVVTA